MKTILAVVGGALALFLTIAMFGGAGWTHPPWRPSRPASAAPAWT